MATLLVHMWVTVEGVSAAENPWKKFIIIQELFFLFPGCWKKACPTFQWAKEFRLHLQEKWESSVMTTETSWCPVTVVATRQQVMDKVR